MKGLTLSQKEQRRVQVLNLVLEGKVQVWEAAKLLGVSERHGWRLLAAYREEGAAGLVHGNRGRPSVRATPQEVLGRLVWLAQERYPRVNHSQLTEFLQEREGLVLSRSTVRRVLVAAGLRSHRRRRPPKHRSRRERYPQEGMLLQIDGSRHDWLEGRGPRLTLIAAIDDATGTVPSGLFREEEDAHGYFLLLREILQRKGVPVALYSDRHGIFQRSPKERESLEEQLLGERQPTQFGQALQELGIHAIFALSPQAKGRIERLWGTFQDRLVVELRLAGASSVEEANAVLQAYLPRFDARFGVPAAEPGMAYRPVPQGLDLDGVLSFKYQRTVATDNTVRFGNRTLQLLPNTQRASYARARVEVQERLDGSLAVCYQGQVLATRDAPPHPVVLRARNGPRPNPAAGNGRLVVGVSPVGARGGARGLPGANGAQGKGGVGLSPDREEARFPAGISKRPKPAPDHPWRRPFKPALTFSLNT